jgi:hypothetical protein
MNSRSLVPVLLIPLCLAAALPAFAATAERVSVSSTGEQGDAPSYYAAISADGRAVAFTSLASKLVPGDTNGYSDVFVRKRWTFRDVTPDFWAYAYIEACYNAGIVAGYLDETYRPTQPVDRAQMAVYVQRAFQLPM